MFRPAWSLEDTQKAAKMWLEGQSATQIALALDGNFTRSAITGKMNRLGLASGKEQRRTHPKPKKAKAEKPVFERFIYIESEPHPPRALVPESTWTRLEFHHSKTLLQLEPNDCRWPVGDDDIQEFCAAPREFLSPYCPHHTKQGKPKE